MQILLKEWIFYYFYTAFDKILRFLLQTKKKLDKKFVKKLEMMFLESFLTCFKIEMSF